jgi:hypothetical protein
MSSLAYTALPVNTAAGFMYETRQGLEDPVVDKALDPGQAEALASLADQAGTLVLTTAVDGRVTVDREASRLSHTNLYVLELPPELETARWQLTLLRDAGGDQPEAARFSSDDVQPPTPGAPAALFARSHGEQPPTNLLVRYADVEVPWDKARLAMGVRALTLVAHSQSDQAKAEYEANHNAFTVIATFGDQLPYDPVEVVDWFVDAGYSLDPSELQINRAKLQEFFPSSTLVRDAVEKEIIARLYNTAAGGLSGRLANIALNSSYLATRQLVDAAQSSEESAVQEEPGLTRFREAVRKAKRVRDLTLLGFGAVWLTAVVGGVIAVGVKAGTEWGDEAWDGVKAGASLVNEVFEKIDQGIDAATDDD